MKTNDDLMVAVSTWLTTLNGLMLAHRNKNFSMLDPTVLSLDVGRKYIRVVSARGNGGGRSVYAFINKENGDVLMPAGWKAPAKHARGNVFDSDNGVNCCGTYGVKYIKGPVVGAW